MTDTDVTLLLQQIETGDDDAKKRLFDKVYDELHEMAAGLMRRERQAHTLQATALVNEVAARLLDDDALGNFPNRAYFFGAAARAMRQILVGHARTRNAQKRGGEWGRVPLDEVLDHLENDRQLDILALDESLQKLAELSERPAEVVLLRFFGGLTMPEIAEQLEVSLSSVEKDYKFARAWLKKELGEKG